MASVICCPKKGGEESENNEDMLPETGFYDQCFMFRVFFRVPITN